jgi:hypothetical protein
MSYPEIDLLNEDEAAIFRAEMQALDEMEREETLALAEERRDREIEHHRAVLLRNRPAMSSAGALEGLKRQITRLNRDISGFEQSFKRDRIPPEYAQRVLWLIDPNANRNPGDPDLDPQIIAWLAVIVAVSDL